MKTKLLLLSALIAPLFVEAGSVVKVVGKPGNWSLSVNGKPYFVAGAAGGAPKKLLASAGGNSFRTWGADNLKKDLADARANGLTVMAGFWLGHAEHGFDYTKVGELEKTEREILEKVEKFKNDDALLCWALGNEMEMNNPHRKEMWTFINDLAAKVKKIDPNHPVCTVVAEIPEQNLREFDELAPNLDFLGINSYGGCPSLGERWRKAGMKRPYLVTEYGARGSWEGPKDSNDIPLEQTSTEKGEFFRNSYRQGIASERGKNCLGSYAFTWGWKVEATPTWHGMLLPDNTFIASAEAIQEEWGKVKVKNHVPKIGTIEKTGESTYSAKASDPDGNPLKWNWLLLSDTGDYDTIGLGLPMPEGWDGAIVSGQGTPSVKVKLPGGGVYRLYAYCFDGKGGAAYANIPLVGKGEPPKKELKPVKMPFAVYADKMGPWAPSGYMGNVRGLKLDANCEESPFEGDTCIRIDYLDHIGWAGIFWQDPANDWGDKPGGRNLTGATTLTFRARGLCGGEKASFFIGGLKDKKFSDTAKAELKDVVMKKEWTRYRIPLDGLDLSTIKTGFGFTVANDGNPFTFFLDDIKFVKE